MTHRVVLLLIFGALCAPAAADDAVYQQKVQPFLTTYCVDCHGGEKPQEKLSLEGTGGKVPAVLNDLDRLDRIAERVRTNTMPPADHQPQPDAAERTVVVDWLDARIDAALGDVSNPGRVTIRRLTKVDYRNTIRDLLGVEVDTGDFPSDDIAHGFDNLAEVISLPPVLMERYLDAAEQISGRWFERTIGEEKDLWPTEKKPGAELARELLVPVMERAYRRPLTEAEAADLLAFYRQCEGAGYGYRGSMEAALASILVSPKFLFRIEDDGSIGQDRALDDFELASRLSYFLWSTMPDERLFELAREGELQEGSRLHEEVRRMLAEAKVRQGLVDNFAAQWLQTRRLEQIGPDERAFPEFDEALRQAMAEETAWVFEAIVREDGSMMELLDADWTFVNERLARHYGIGGVAGGEFRRVDLKGLPRRGVLTHAGVLALTSNPTRTSPVKRGKWIMEAILGTPPPPPVPDAGALEAVKVSGTLRERLEQHRANPRCASCHNRMDPLGLAFEHFDAIGAWREKDDGGAIDATGTLPDGAEFDGALELIDVLRERHAGQFRKNVARQMLVYALGRKLERYDRPVVREIEKRMREGGDTVSSVVLAIVDSPPFRKRRNPAQVGIEGLPPEVTYELSGNPDQQMILTLRARKGVEPPSETVPLEVHSLKPLLRAIAGPSRELQLARQPGESDGPQVYRYPVEAALNEPVRLFFMPGLIAPGEYSDDFLMPVTPIPETDQNLVMQVARWNQAWGADLTGPVNPRQGTVYSFDFDVRLVAKERDRVDVWINIGGAHNKSVFAAGGAFDVEGEGTHRLTRVGRRTTSMGGAWAHDISVLIRTRAQTVVSNMSPIRFIRPKLGVSDTSAIDLGTVPAGPAKESGQREVYNAQGTALTDHTDKTWNTILYGAARLVQPDKQRQYVVETEHVGIELVGEHAGKFQLVGEHAAGDGALKLFGADGEPGLEGGKEPEREAFAVRFRGAKEAGMYEAAVRIVTQAGGVGTLSQGKEGEPQRGLYYVDIPVRVEVK